jgi:hypothetical protein
MRRTKKNLCQGIPTRKPSYVRWKNLNKVQKSPYADDQLWNSENLEEWIERTEYLFEDGLIEDDT